MLRREKKDVFKPAGGDGQQGTAEPDASAGAASAAEGSSTDGAAKPAAMPHKNDLIVWLKLKPMQRRVYQAFLNSGKQKNNTSKIHQDRSCGMLRCPEPLTSLQAHPTLFPVHYMRHRRREEGVQPDRLSTGRHHCAQEGGAWLGHSQGTHLVPSAGQLNAAVCRAHMPSGWPLRAF